MDTSANIEKGGIGFRHYESGLLALLLAAAYFQVIARMVAHWDADPNYSHGFIVPFISAYFLWQEKDRLSGIRQVPSSRGLLVLAAGLLLYILAFLAAELFTMRISLLVCLAGVIIISYGMAFFRAVLLPYCYLYFMIPLPYLLYDAVAFPLKLFVAKYSVITMQLIGISVLREGNIIILPNTTLEVADACSGIRSLMSLLALGVAYAHFSQRKLSRKIMLVASTIPIAIFANSIRVIGTGVLARFYGAKVAEGFFHEFAGLVIFAVSIALLIGIGALLSRTNADEEQLS
ncbi:MAG: exosortase/archaeosortase family protein [Nitrospirae bacterium]|nr:exosortase/archaeosortase family protein [Nitrospirota bacterium]